MMAEELAHYAIRLMWDEAGGGFLDRAAEPAGGEPEIGLMRRPLKPFALNCDASRTLRRLALASGDHEFARIADRTSTRWRRLPPARDRWRRTTCSPCAPPGRGDRLSDSERRPVRMPE